MKYVFGPVASRRLGKSLGIDPIPVKTCNWNCIYCQLGRTAPVANVRKEYFPSEKIVAEVKEAVQKHKPGEIDWITFVGSGEPTLHSQLGWMIREIKNFTSIPVAVITNGSLLHLEEVREELSAADAVLPTLDAGTESLYRKINRPHPEITFERLIDGLKSFRKVYQGKLWVEVMLIHGLTDTEENLQALAIIFQQIHPDIVHLSLPVRPPAEHYVKPADEEGLLRAVAIIGRTAEVVRPSEILTDISRFDQPLEALADIISRHPLSEDEIKRSLSRWSDEEVARSLKALAQSGRARVIERYNTRFWTLASGQYTDKQG